MNQDKKCEPCLDRDSDPATVQMRDAAKARGLETVWDRSSANVVCKFGSEGICCKICNMGPCRISSKTPKGTCGADADTIAARNLSRAVAAGTSAHSDHGRHLVHTLKMVAEGKTDSYTITDERKQKVDFTNKYYQTPARFVAKKGAGITISKEGLKGKTVGVQRATIHENFVRDMFGDAVTIKAYATQDEANMDLVAGRLDLVIADATVLLGGFLSTDAGKGFEFVGPSYVDKKWFGEGVGIAVRKGDTDLLQKLNKAIAAIRANGVYQKINAKYFDFDVYGN